MKRTGVVFVVLLFVVFFELNSNWTIKSNILPIVKKGIKNINFEVNTLERNAVFYIHYRSKGLEGFQVRKMSLGKDGRVYFKLSTKNLYGKKLEYYITNDNNTTGANMTPVFTVTNFTNKSSPAIYFMAAASADMMAKKNREHIVKLTASLSTTSRIQDNAQYPGKKYTANGNFRLYRNIYKDKYQFDFDSNFSYINRRIHIKFRIYNILYEQARF